ncbi:T9SS type A sorting domain-containing protein, partial [bacterium]|nr:T9SS type A sorting domain-containing protein [bacterium]
PLPYDGQIGDYPYGSIPNAQAICRNKTRSVVVVQGVPNNEDPDDAVLWTMCGNPLASVPLPLWVRAGSVPVEFDGNNGSLICDRGAELADWICDYVNPDSVVNTWKLTNPDEDGLWDAIFPWSDGVFTQVNSFTSSDDFSYDDLEAFQNGRATQILDYLEAWPCPVWTSVPYGITGDESVLIEFNVSGTTPNGALTIAFNRNGLPEAAQFTDNEDGSGSFSWQTTFDDAGNYTPIFTLSDGVLSTVDTSVPITVNDVNLAPVLAAIGDKAVNENATLAFTLSATDPDDDGFGLTYSALNLPAGATLTGPDFSWTPTYDQAGAYDVTFEVSDGDLTDDEIITITVNDVNQPPIWTDVPVSISVDETDPIAFTVTGMDPEGDELSITLDPDGIPDGYVFIDNNDGTADFSWETAEGDAGNYTATFTISDGVNSVDAVVPISVTASGPGVAYASSETTPSGSVQGDYTYTVDSDNSYEILTEISSDGNPAKRRYSLLEHVWTFEITGFELVLHAEAYRPSNNDGDDFVLAGSFDGQNYTDLITITKTADDDNEQTAQIDGDAYGQYYVRVTDTDHTAANLSLDSFHLDMLSIAYMTGDVPNRAPIWTDVPESITGYAGDIIQFAVTGSDPDDDNLSISLATDVPEGYNFTDNGDGTASFSWQTTVDDLGDYTATFTISDVDFDVDAVVTIHVVEAPEPGTMYVSAIDLTENVINKNFSTCIGVATVIDLSDAAVEGALVTATWSGLYNRADVQGTTDGSGQFTFVTGNMRNPYGLVTLTITDVTKAAWTWDEDNSVTEDELGMGDYGAGWGDLVLNPVAPIPEVAMLNPAYPNPFNNSTTIGFGLPEDAKVRITVYDLTGRRVETLINGYVQAGWHSTTWTPQLLANGEYIIRLEAGEFVKARRLVFLK